MHKEVYRSVLINRECKNKITDWEAADENMIRININILQHKLTIFDIYLISNDANINGKDFFFDRLSPEIIKVGNNREIILLGSFNSRTGWIGNGNIVGP